MENKNITKLQNRKKQIKLGISLKVSEYPFKQNRSMLKNITGKN